MLYAYYFGASYLYHNLCAAPVPRSALLLQLLLAMKDFAADCR